jgi:protein gp37
MAARGLPGLNSPTTGEPFAVMRDSGPRWTGKVELIESALGLPLHWRKPRRIFVNSMSDLFHESLSAYDISRAFAVMRVANWHTYMILTKRATRMFSLLRSAPWWAGTEPDVWKHVWLGVSVEDRKNKERIELLRETPAALHFLSLEPLLEDLGELDLTGISWCIIGGESGPGARRCDVDWIRKIVWQCQVASIPVFVKQLGAHVIENGERRIKRDKKGGDMDEWAHDIRLREWPEAPNAK